MSTITAHYQDQDVLLVYADGKRQSMSAERFDRARPALERQHTIQFANEPPEPLKLAIHEPHPLEGSLSRKGSEYGPVGIDGYDLPVEKPEPAPASVFTQPPAETQVVRGTLEKSLAEMLSREQAIAILKERYAGLTADTKPNYELVRTGLAELRTIRVEIEKRRVALKADALEWGRKVDAEAKRLTSIIEDIESPLKFAKQIADEEKAVAKAKRDKEERDRVEAEARKRLEEEEARLRADREAEESRLKVIREAETERLRIENERLAKERAELDRQRKEMEELQRQERLRMQAAQEVERQKQQAERDQLAAERKAAEESQRIAREKLDAERKVVEEARQRTERAEFERLAREKAEREAKEKVEREAKEKAIAERLEAERRAEEASRLWAMKPDIDKVRKFADDLRTLPMPEVTSKEAAAELARAKRIIVGIADALVAWNGK